MMAAKHIIFILLIVLMSGVENPALRLWMPSAAPASSCCCGGTIEKQCACQSGCCGVPQPAGTSHGVYFSGACGDSGGPADVVLNTFKYVVVSPHAVQLFPQQSTYPGNAESLPIFNLLSRIERPPITPFLHS